MQKDSWSASETSRHSVIKKPKQTDALVCQRVVTQKIEIFNLCSND